MTATQAAPIAPTSVTPTAWLAIPGVPFGARLSGRGVVRKKLGLTLQSEKTDGERVYRVIEPQAA
jgi:hypothetical protein